MFSNNLKRSVATLGVVAGLLAAAVPASAMPAGTAPPLHNDALQASQNENQGMFNDNVPLEQVPFNKGAASERPQGVIWDLLEQANAGTQVGSEGVKASASGSADPIPTESISFVKGPHKSVVVVTGDEDNVQ